MNEQELQAMKDAMVNLAAEMDNLKAENEELRDRVRDLEAKMRLQ